MFFTIRAVYEQQKYMYDNRTHSVPDRIVSVSQPFVRPIVRGKAGKPVEFGAKLDISVVDGWTRLECCSFDAYNEAGNLREMAERFRAREGHYPSRILADKIYRNRENLSYCKAHGIRLSGPALGRPKKGETRDKAQDDRDECERVEVERRFSLAKRKCGMGLVTAKLRETAAHVIAMSVLALNLRKIQCALLRMLAYLLELLAQNKNWALVQWSCNINEYLLALRQVPEPVLAAFNAAGWAYRIDFDYISELSKQLNMSCIGATSYSQKTIYLSEASATLHEFGHFLDWTLGIPAEHEQLYLAEAKNSGLRDYAKTNAREYFADSFDYWITHGSNSEMMEHLRKNAPQTWAYFEALEKNNWSG